MKKLLFALFMSASLATFSQENSSKEKETTRKLPSVDVKTPDAKTFNTSSFDNGGKPIVICFWATWCKPCVQELNAISELYDEWKKETGVKIIALSIDDARTLSRVGPFANGKNWEYEVYIDPNGDFKRAMNVNMPPHSFVLDGEKNIKWQHVSYSPGDEQKLFEAIKSVSKTK